MTNYFLLNMAKTMQNAEFSRIQSAGYLPLMDQPDVF